MPDVAQLRESTGLSQSRFAQLLGVSPRTLQDWEQGRRAPSGAARTLLLVAARDPKALLAVALAHPTNAINSCCCFAFNNGPNPALRLSACRSGFPVAGITAVTAS